MYLQQANQKDMIFNVIDVLSQPPTEMLDFLYSKRKKNKFLLFEIFNDIYFIKHRCKYALIRFQMFLKYFYNNPIYISVGYDLLVNESQTVKTNFKN